MNITTGNIRSDLGNTDSRPPYAGWHYGASEPFRVTYTPVNAGIFNIYLFGEIEDATQFINAIEVLQQATEKDVVVIHLSTNGGSLDATDTFLTAMDESEALVVVKATGGVHSAGTVILLHADEFQLSENFNALIHNGSCGSGGKFSDFVAQSIHNVKYMHTVMFKTYRGFLTDQEIMQLLEGKDFWIDSAEFIRRHELRNAYDAAEAVQAETDLADLLAAASHQEPEVAPKPSRKKK
jgi:ATP-dependent protease ClpP protease subunit